ncbi:unnamed protein product [Gongylonema pulchrum]|uniref:Fes1 domain-containing protein n=1 Tax=Gongylonema pulchrum TaxID=637853 RepID=A0A183DTJ3_9BILA|nr:unnamed protein product [Gongylonema pulchrum]
MDILCEALEHFSTVEEVTEPTLCALRHCTARHPLASQAQSDIRLSQTLPVILELIASMRAPVVKAALGLETTAKGESVVTLAMDVLGRAGVQLRQDPDALADGVAMRELVEEIFQLLSWEEVYANDDELLQRELLGLLYQLSKTPEGARQLDMYGPAPVLAEALHSRHKAISTYASGVLKNLQFDKPLIYREEIDTEIESAMNGVAGEEWMHDGLEPELFSEMYRSSEMEHLDRPQPWQHPPPYQTNNRSPSWFDTDL